MGMGSGERGDKGMNGVVGFAWLGTILRSSLYLKGTSDARHYRYVGRGSVIIYWDGSVRLA